MLGHLFPKPGTVGSAFIHVVKGYNDASEHKDAKGRVSISHVEDVLE